MTYSIPDKFIQDQIITARFKDGTSWKVNLNDIALVGEYSTQDGPGGDDHFVCIVGKDGTRYDVSHEEGAVQLLNELEVNLGQPLTPQLVLSTDFRSCILYPQCAVGRPLFLMPKKPETIIQHLKLLFSRGDHELQLSDTAKALLGME